MSGEAVQIAVRVRPFNDKEKEQNQTLCIEMTDKKVTNMNLQDPRLTKSFTFDHALWSYDGFENDAEGYSHAAPGSQYADQKSVWKKLGESILDKAWKGLNCTLFAYGQTGSGKSYSIFGYGKNAGIVPMASTEIFRRINENNDPEVTFQVQVMMVEIYMEKLQDLLVPKAQQGKKELKVKQSKNHVYVDGAKKVPVTSYEQIWSVIDMGEKNRTIGSTQMNQTSSRSHTVVTIELVKISMFKGKKSQTNSIINIVDLAGSEKSTQAGTSGDRLKEGNAINQSLTTLGNVITALAEQSTGKAKKNSHVPFRDSVLTRMLQQALGGNSSTIMVCAIRPGDLYFDETMNTLKYADRAKQIKNKPTINESDSDKLVRELMEENKRLKEELAKGGGGGGGGGADPASLKALQEKEEELARNKAMIDEMNKSWEDKLAEQKKEEEEQEKIKKEEEEARVSGRPQILNLNEDGVLDRKIFFDLSKHTAATIGRKQPEGSEQPLLTLGGIGIQNKHACFETDSKGVTYLKPLSAEALPHIFINGEKLTKQDKVKLAPNDRIIFGGTAFLYRCQNRDNEVELKDTKENPITFEMAMQEKLVNEDKQEASRKAEEKKRLDEETAAKMAELAAKMEGERAKEEAQRIEMQKKYEEEMAKMKAEIDAKHNDEDAKREAEEREAKMRLEMEFKLEQDKLNAQKEEAERQDRIRREEASIKARQAEYSALEQKLGNILPLVNEANLIGQELKREIRFNTKMERVMPEFGSLQDSRTEILLKVDNKEDNYYYQWDTDKFTNRLYMMRELLNQYYDSGELPDFEDKDKDPFWDPPEPLLIGTCYLQLKNLSFTLENELDAKIMSTEGAEGVRGKLAIKYFPSDAAGDGEPDDELFVEEPAELLGKEIYFRVEIEKGIDLPKDLCKNVFVTYQFKHEPGVIYSTEEYNGQNRNPEFAYKKVHHIDLVTDYILEYFDTGNIPFKAYAYPEFMLASRIERNQGKNDPRKGKAPAAAATSSDAFGGQGKDANGPQSSSNVAQEANSTPATDKETTVVTTDKTAIVQVTDKKKGSSCCTIF